MPAFLKEAGFSEATSTQNSAIDAASLFTRNLYREYLHRNASENEQANVAKCASVAVNHGALLFVIFLPMSYGVNLQLLGGVLLLQTFPAIVFGSEGQSEAKQRRCGHCDQHAAKISPP
ncbi:hypothetical protein [Edaphobacter sp. 12200R-103]|jgi:Na+/proline symporter|uniref:hypothetical protein n=1 Tax=Edaphobacter sp. 12200R-103 TaxID=2703788 RepID=UPI00138D5F33|nr:hypothetical protein [Edaphobacter sp. 12200R-103]QHS53115.1 hypothetical protein GWR55_16345 [Edaphobacter sp. 12200R-103]